MIDLAEMHDDPRRPGRAHRHAPRAARRWAELNAATGAHGLAVTGGAISTTGIAGSRSAAGSAG